jgi:3-methylcrotonyl-CoA carboxylase alpha subunit
MEDPAMKRSLESRFALDSAESALAATLDGTRLEVEIDGTRRVFEAQVRDGEVTLRAEDGRVIHAFVARDLSVSLHGITARIQKVEQGKKRSVRSADEAALEAPMPGTCREVFVAPGASVSKGQRLVLIEAMKMEHEIRSPRDGVVKSVSAKKGEPVAPGSPLVELE